MTIAMHFYIIIFLLSFVNCEIQGRASSQVFQKLADGLFPALFDQIADIEIPSISSQTNVKVLGTIHYQLKDVTIQDVHYQNTIMTLSDSLNFHVTGISVQVTLKWAFRKLSFPFFPSGSGSAVVKMSDSGIFVGIQPTVTELGQPSGVVQRLDLNLDNIDIHVSGSKLSWIYNFLINAFKSNIKKAIHSRLSNELYQLLGEVTQKLSQSFPVVRPISDSIQLNYSLTSVPKFISNHDSDLFAIVGEFQSIEHPQRVPLPHSELEVGYEFDRMLCVCVDQLLFNSYLYTSFQAGTLKFRVREDYPFHIGVGYNTNDWKSVIPTLYEQFPKRDIEIEISAYELPAVDIGNEVAQVKANLLARFFVDNSTESQINRDVTEWLDVFTILFNGETTLSVEFISDDDLRILPKLKNVEFVASVYESNIGEIDIVKANKILKPFVNSIVVPFANDAISDGFPLPAIKGFSLENANFQFHIGYFSIDADLSYEITVKSGRMQHR